MRWRWNLRVRSLTLPCNALCDQSQQLKFIYLNLFHHHNKNIKIGGRSRRLQQLLFLLDGPGLLPLLPRCCWYRCYYCYKTFIQQPHKVKHESFFGFRLVWLGLTLALASVWNWGPFIFIIVPQIAVNICRI